MHRSDHDKNPDGCSPVNNTAEDTVIILGLVLLVLGFLFHISILWTIGIILLVVGAVLLLLGSMGRAVGGRKHYF
jgi:predicted acyltransferase